MSAPYTYYLYHVPTGKKYYGYQSGTKELWNNYFSSSKKVKELIEEYGETSFQFEIRNYFETPEEAFNWEQKVLRRIGAVDRDDWLNQSLANGPFYMKNNHTEKAKKKIIAGLTGRPVSEKTRQKMRESALKRPPVSLETRKKRSENRKGKTSFMKGKHFPKEFGEKLSKIQKGKSRGPMSEKTKSNISKANKGRIMSEEWRQKLSVSAKNRPPITEETRQKLKARIPWNKRMK